MCRLRDLTYSIALYAQVEPVEQQYDAEFDEYEISTVVTTKEMTKYIQSGESL